MRGRSRSGPFATFDPPHQHLCSCNIRADSHPRRLGVQALMSTRKDSAYGCFHNGCHGVEAACAFSPPGWSRSLPRMSARAILIKPQPRHRVNTPREKSVHSPIRLGMLCITSHVESKVLGNFILVAKEELE